MAASKTSASGEKNAARLGAPSSSGWTCTPRRKRSRCTRLSSISSSLSRLASWTAWVCGMMGMIAPGFSACRRWKSHWKSE